VSGLQSLGRLGGALAEVSLALAPWAPAPSPKRTRNVDVPWLGPRLAAGVPGAQLLAITRLGGTTGTTDRLRIGLEWNVAGVEAGLPASVFLKGTAPSAKNRAMVAGLWMATNEVKFYLTARPTLPDIAPAAYVAQSGHGARFMLVLEDLVAKRATPFTIADSCTLSHAEAMMDTLAQLHAKFWSSPRLQTDLAWAAGMTGRTGFPLLAFAFRRTRGKFLADADKRELGPSTRRMLRLATDNDLDLYRMWETGPQTLVHGDSHVGNSFAFADGRAGLLDWQVVFRTRGTREVVYFLTGALDIEARREHEQRLLQRYLDGLHAAGVPVPPTFEEAWEDYRFFAYDVWDSCALTMLWPGLQEQEMVIRGYKRVSALVEDLAVDEVLDRRLRNHRPA
jgi:hypothetical protein